MSSKLSHLFAPFLSFKALTQFPLNYRFIPSLGFCLIYSLEAKFPFLKMLALFQKEKQLK